VKPGDQTVNLLAQQATTTWKHGDFRMTFAVSSRRQFCGMAGALGIALTVAPSLASAAASTDVLSRRRAWTAPSDNYTRFYELFESEVVRRGSGISPLTGPAEPFDFTFEFDGRAYTIEEYQQVTKTYGLIVVKDGQVLHEGYGRGATQESLLWSASMSKSVVSILAGIAVGQGKIGSVDDQVVQYLPELAGSGYDGATIGNLLHMRSGVDWDDSFFVPGPALDAQAASLIENRARYADFALPTHNGYAPGSRLNYNSMDTAVVGWLVERATGTPLPEFTSRHLWQPLGAEADAYWLTDGPSGVGRAFAAGGYNARLRDYARIGLMMLNGGIMGDRRILPEGWTRATFTPPEPEQHEGLYQYGYQWWLLDGQPGYSAIGGFGQYIHVNPEAGLVIAKNSWNPAPSATRGGRVELIADDDMARAFFAAVADRVA
jgi:CubicO group peptidase (beta-lactamase class C family)